MKNFIILNKKAGGILAMTIFAAVFLVGLTALVTDVGMLYYSQARLQTAVNAGWKAGFDRMMQLKNDNLFTEEEKQMVRDHIKEVMKQNKYTDEELVDLKIEFGPNNYLAVGSKQKVGLFFARVIDINVADVAAARASHANSFGQGVVPLAVPHGVTKDLSKNFYICSLFGPDSGFASGSEYILKLGSGGGNNKLSPIITDPNRKILVPMDSGAQTDDGFLKAYGAVYWCLKMDDTDSGYTPVKWLLGYRGGSFLLPYHDDVVNRLNLYGVNYLVLAGDEEIQPILDAVGDNVQELVKRPRVGVYSTHNFMDPVAKVLEQAFVPYGAYSQPGAWTRKSDYKALSNTVLTDASILNGALADYEWLHLYNEDLTGFSAGCEYWLDSCRDFCDAGRLGDTSNVALRKKVLEKMCSYCQGFYNIGSGLWKDGYLPKPDDDTHNCINVRRRCVDKRNYLGQFWKDDGKIPVCGAGAAEPVHCVKAIESSVIAEDNGYADDANASPKPQFAVYQDGSNPLPDDLDGWFNRATAVQKMKWDIAGAFKAHAENGGYLFAQSLSAESLELALWQRAIYAGVAPLSAYEECLAFSGFHYRSFPRDTGDLWYSDINSGNSAGSFNLTDPLDPLCQNHASGYVCDTGSGKTDSFLMSLNKLTTTVLGYQDGSGGSAAKYIKGTVGPAELGSFAFLSGDNINNVYTQRLILNNILMASIAEKSYSWSGDTYTITGRQKSNYGPVDPDNVVGGGADDYRDRFINGFNAPLEVNDRLITIPGNKVGPTDEAVDARVNGTDMLEPNRRIIVPITDVGPEIAYNNPKNADANTAYDLQGNDQPGGVYDPALYGFGASTRIIGFAEFEVIDSAEYTRDGEGYQPGDSGDLGPYQSGQVRGRFIRYIVKPGEIPLN